MCQTTEDEFLLSTRLDLKSYWVHRIGYDVFEGFNEREISEIVYPLLSVHACEDNRKNPRMASFTVRAAGVQLCQALLKKVAALNRTRCPHFSRRTGAPIRRVHIALRTAPWSAPYIIDDPIPENAIALAEKYVSCFVGDRGCNILGLGKAIAATKSGRGQIHVSPVTASPHVPHLLVTNMHLTGDDVQRILDAVRKAQNHVNTVNT
jgi:hypothetical protein